MSANIDSTSKPRRRSAAKPVAPTAPADSGTTPATPSKLDQLAALLTAPSGATLAAMVAATGWQVHSVRGAMAGALKKRGLAITSTKTDGVRVYCASVAA